VNVTDLAPIVQGGPTPLFATISGAHLYGFESPDSDYDLRGAFVAPLRRAIALRPFEETVTVMERRGELELDWVAHDVKKFARMLTQHNGYVLEQLYSPLVVVGGPWLEELRATKAPTQCMGTQTSGGTTDGCDGTLTEDWNAFMASHPTALGQPLAGGETVWAQAWFRDPAAAKTTNLSDGITFTVAP
jgi:hypothetical protein